MLAFSNTFYDISYSSQMTKYWRGSHHQSRFSKFYFRTNSMAISAQHRKCGSLAMWAHNGILRTSENRCICNKNHSTKKAGLYVEQAMWMRVNFLIMMKHAQWSDLSLFAQSICFKRSQKLGSSICGNCLEETEWIDLVTYICIATMNNNTEVLNTWKIEIFSSAVYCPLN